MTRESISENIERRARRAILEHALFRVENAVLIAGAILLAFFLPHPLPGLLPWWDWWTWLLIGFGGVAIIVASSLADKDEAARVVDSLFQQEYNINGVRDKSLQEKLKRARDYHEEIKNAVKAQSAGLLRDRLKRTTDQIYDWIGNMVRLARRVDAYRSDPIIRNDAAELRQSLPTLENRLKTETDSGVRSQLEATLAEKRRLRDNLVELDNRMKRADLQLDSSLAALGTVYSQLLLVGSKDVDGGQTERLQADIAGEVTSLQDVVDSINEIYDYHTPGPRQLISNVMVHR